MFKFDTQCNPRQISLTGVRAICIFALLSIEPRTFEYIRNFLIESNIVTREYSIDTIRIDLNTLKYIGCEISKATKKTDNKYVLISHPFQLVLDENDINALTKTYKYLSKNLSIERLLEYDALLTKLSNSVSDENIKQALLGISVFKGLDKDLVKEILLDSKRNTRMTIEYVSGGTKTTNFDITIDNLGFRSGKLYIYCINHTMNKRTFLLFSRLRKVLFRQLKNESTINTNDIVVKFELKNHREYVLEESEKVIEEKESSIIVEGTYYTEFIALQRLLYLNSDCVIIEPQSIKNKLIEKLQKMRSLYD